MSFSCISCISFKNIPQEKIGTYSIPVLCCQIVGTRSIFAATIAAKRQAGCIELNMFLHTLVQDATKKLCIEGNTTDYVWCRDLSFNNLSGDVPINGSFSLFTPIRYPRLSLSTSFSALEQVLFIGCKIWGTPLFLTQFYETYHVDWWLVEQRKRIERLEHCESGLNVFAMSWLRSYQ